MFCKNIQNPIYIHSVLVHLGVPHTEWRLSGATIVINDYISYDVDGFENQYNYTGGYVVSITPLNVTSDISCGNRLFVGRDVSLNGNIYTGGRIGIGNAPTAGILDISGSVIRNVVTSSGYLGIGKTNPSAALDVNGSSITSTYYYFNAMGAKPTLYDNTGTVVTIGNNPSGYYYCKFTASTASFTPTYFNNGVGMYAPVNGIYNISFTLHDLGPNSVEMFIYRNYTGGLDGTSTLACANKTNYEMSISSCVYLTTLDCIVVGFCLSSGTAQLGNRSAFTMALIQRTG